MTYDQRDAALENFYRKQAEDAAHRLRRLGFEHDARRLDRQSQEHARRRERMLEESR